MSGTVVVKIKLFNQGMNYSDIKQKNQGLFFINKMHNKAVKFLNFAYKFKIIRFLLNIL